MISKSLEKQETFCYRMQQKFEVQFCNGYVDTPGNAVEDVLDLSHLQVIRTTLHICMSIDLFEALFTSPADIKLNMAYNSVIYLSLSHIVKRESALMVVISGNCPVFALYCAKTVVFLSAGELYASSQSSKLSFMFVTIIQCTAEILF